MWLIENISLQVWSPPISTGWSCSIEKNGIVQSLSHVWLFVTPWTAAHQAFLSFTVSLSLLKLMSIESVMPSNHLILCRPLLLPSIFPSIRLLSSELALCIRWSKYWSFGFSVSPSNEYSELISFRIDCFPCCSDDFNSIDERWKQMGPSWLCQRWTEMVGDGIYVHIYLFWGCAVWLVGS